jgi:hypothetical protein
MPEMKRWVPIAAVFVAWWTPLRAQDTGYTGYYESCVVAAKISTLSDLDKPQFQFGRRCYEAMTAILAVSSFFTREYAICPPKGSSPADAAAVIARYPKLRESERGPGAFYGGALYALTVNWPCPKQER